MLIRASAILLLLISISCHPKKAGTEDHPTESTSEFRFQFPDSLSARRMAFVMTLRDSVSGNYWEAFNDKRTEGPFIYFNGEASEIFFPDSIVLSRVSGAKTYSDDYMVSPRTDTIPYHFELMISFAEADSAKFYFDHPVQQFLNVEETGLYIPSIQSTEWWATMVIHEMFHHFQYNHKQFKDYAKNHIAELPVDIRDLRRICATREFHEDIQRENRLLMSAIDTKNESDLYHSLNTYLESRKERIKNFSEQLPLLEEVENFYVLQEGTARYTEYQTMKVLNNLSRYGQGPVVSDDPKFNSFSDFRHIDLQHDDFNYLVYPAAEDYHYTIGFNLLRVLDKLGVDYKSGIFEHPEKGLHEYIGEFLGE